MKQCLIKTFTWVCFIQVSNLISHPKEEYKLGILENKRIEWSNGTVEDNLRVTGRWRTICEVTSFIIGTLRRILL